MAIQVSAHMCRSMLGPVKRAGEKEIEREVERRGAGWEREGEDRWKLAECIPIQ